MKIVPFFFVCMTWIKCTISADTSSDDQYDQKMFAYFLRESTQFDRYRQRGPKFEIHDGDLITIHKVINGRFAPHDAVEGHLHSTTSVAVSRAPHGPSVNNDRYGEVDIMIGENTSLYHAHLKRREKYVDHKHEGDVKYFCEIERDDLAYLVAILRIDSEPFVHENLPRVEFKNHLYRGSQDLTFTGRLIAAHFPNVHQRLLKLRA